jgi:hypothetical protein
MARLSKKAVLALIFMVVFGVFLISPSVVIAVEPYSVAPEVVSVVVYNDPIWNPPTYTTNPYTGEVMVSPGTWSRNGTIEVTIKNEPFVPYVDENGTFITVKYSFVWKAHFRAWDSYSTGGFASHIMDQSDSDYTVVNFLYGVHGSSAYPVYNSIGSFNVGDMIDFRVRARIGYSYQLNQYPNEWVFVGEISEWSDDYTVTMPPVTEPGTSTPVSSPPPNTSTTNKPSTSNPNSPAQQQKTPQYTLIILLVSVGIITLLLAVIAYQHKQRKTKPANVI